MYGRWFLIFLGALLICTLMFQWAGEKLEKRKLSGDIGGIKKWKGITITIGCSVIAIALVTVVAFFGVNYVEVEPVTIETVKISSLSEFEYESGEALRAEVNRPINPTIRLDGTEYEVDRVLYNKNVTEATLRVENRYWKLDRKRSLPLPGLPEVVNRETKVTLLMPMNGVKP